MKLFLKIREKGLYGCLRSIKIKLIRISNYFMFKYYAHLE